MKKWKVCIPSFVVLFLLTGCWNYKGLNEFSFVSGVAVDYDFDKELYLLTLEVIDVQTSGDGSAPSTLQLETHGKSILDALRNAENRTRNQLYFSTVETVFINPQLAEKKGVFEVIDWFMRDSQCRLSVVFTVTEFEPAKKAFSMKITEEAMLSFDVYNILNNQGLITSSAVQLYEAVDWMNSPGSEMFLPLLSAEKKEDREVLVANGIAVFRGARMIGQLSAEDTRFFLFAMDRVKGGVMVLEYTPGAANATEPIQLSLEVADSKTSRTFIQNADTLEIRIEAISHFYVDEADAPLDLTNLEVLEEIEKQAQEHLREQIKGLIERTREKYEADVFRFGHTIYLQDVQAWKLIEADWQKTYSKIRIDVQTEVKIYNTGLTKKS